MTGSTSWLTAARALALDEAAVATTKILEAADIDVLLIKGPVTAARLYAESPDARGYSDVDLLVAPDQFARAQATLAGNGYVSASAGLRPSEIDQREVTWFCPGNTRLAIDLHRSLAWVGDPSALWFGLWGGRTSLNLQGRKVQIPDAAGSALIVTLHASRAGSSRKPFRDLARAVATFDDGQWRRAIALARDCDALTGFSLGLDTVSEARPLLARFDLPVTAPTAMRVYSAGGVPAGMTLGRLMATHGGLARARYVADRVWPSVAFMHKAWPASNSGTSALLRAHGLRWRRFVRTLPRGLVELRRARQGGPAGRDDWTTNALVAVRAQLAESGIEQLGTFRRPGRTVTDRSVAIILQRNSATCLERSLVRQRFYSARGYHRTLLVGVSPPKDGFRAHAWLSGDPEEGDDSYQIIHRIFPKATSSNSARSAVLGYRDKYRHHPKERDQL